MKYLGPHFFSSEQFNFGLKASYSINANQCVSSYDANQYEIELHLGKLPPNDYKIDREAYNPDIPTSYYREDVQLSGTLLRLFEMKGNFVLKTISVPTLDSTKIRLSTFPKPTWIGIVGKSPIDRSYFSYFEELGRKNFEQKDGQILDD